MASRPVFVPDPSHPPFVKEVWIEFPWIPGQALSQVQKCICSFHKAAENQGLVPLLEISSKSLSPSGVMLSAFNLRFNTTSGRNLSVECAFQGSKVFQRGGPFNDLYDVSSSEAKKDERLRNSGELIGFNYLGDEFPVNPPTAFYDWLYLNALYQNPALAKELEEYAGFTDIAFNPQKSLNCQARSAALFVALSRMGEIENVIRDREYYFALISNQTMKPEAGRKLIQEELFK